MMEKEYTDPEIGRVVLRRKAGVRRMNIRVSEQKGVSVTVPFTMSFDKALNFFLANREWVLRTLARQRATPVQRASAEDIDRLRKEAAAFLPKRLNELGGRYGFSWNRLSLKHNKTNWGSCSGRDNINLNISLMALPPLLRDYVILHELCHLSHHDHSRGFHSLLENLLSDHVRRILSGGDTPGKSGDGSCDRVAEKSDDDFCGSATEDIPDDMTQNDCSGLRPKPDDPLLARIMVQAAKSTAEFPFDHTLSRALRKHRPL